MSQSVILQFLIIFSFALGYILITIEHTSKINKTAVAILMAIFCWIFQFSKTEISMQHHLTEFGSHMSDVSQVVFFLLGALGIVEMISAHQGFQILSNSLQIRSKRNLLWLTGFVAFFLSSILDNLTTTIIMVTLLHKVLKQSEERLLFGSTVVVAANAGGAWTPIGDVTTTMLWIGGQVSTFSVIKELFLPSLACLIGFLAYLTPSLKGEFIFEKADVSSEKHPNSQLIFCLGLFCLTGVPFFKIITGLPPFMGMLLGLGIMWLVTDILYRNNSHTRHLRMPVVLSSIDLSGVLFFLGILLCVDALHAAGILTEISMWLNDTLRYPEAIAIAIGLASAVVDNVPLVAAIMKMYSLNQFPTDSEFWNLIAYCAGTGGSILVIGSAAGVAYMGLEKVQFFWYLRRIGVPATVGYFTGIAVFKLIQFI